MDEIKTEKQLVIEKIFRGLKDLVLSSIFMIIIVVAFFYIAPHVDFKNPENENLILYALVPFGAVIILLLISIYKIAKALEKNAVAWIFACIAFPIILYFAVPYFFIIAVFQIIKLKFSKDAEQVSPEGQPGPAAS